MRDQIVNIVVPGQSRIGRAVGGPDLIYERLLAGAEILCQGPPGSDEYIIRLAPGTPFYLTYGEGVVER